jgi:hypothetical protein
VPPFTDVSAFDPGVPIWSAMMLLLGFNVFIVALADAGRWLRWERSLVGLEGGKKRSNVNSGAKGFFNVE